MKPVHIKAFWESHNMGKKILIAVVSGVLISASSVIVNNHIRSISNARAMNSLTDSVDKVVTQLETISRQNQALILVTTFRTDPWSGEMMKEFQDQWYDLLKPIYPELKHSDIPDVDSIQKKRAADLIPPDFFDSYGAQGI